GELLLPSQFLLLYLQLVLWFIVLSDYQVEVEEGAESVKLPCKTVIHLPKDVKAVWTDSDNDTTVHVYQHGSDQPEEQNQVYRDRTEMKKDPLETGNFSLTLKNPKHTDTGRYECSIYNQDGNTVRGKTVQLEVKGQYEDTGQRSLILTEKLCLRAEFLQYSRQITLDPNTANTHLILSEENRKVTFNDKGTPYPHHPDRFTDTPQVLSKEGLTGRCYWEVEKKKSWNVGVAVAYKSVDRSLTSLSSGYTFYHDGQQTFISGPVPSRIGVYLDHSAGILSFYSISSDTMRLLHRVQTTFTEPLHAGFYLYGPDGNTVEVETLCAPGGDNSAPRNQNLRIFRLQDKAG
uniref:Ig-like domain-containing protein n=1 Tax=Sparus aurata TaxID=8175 RepID=A0A671TQ09_SPAAU